MTIRLNPVTARRLRRFRSIKRGYGSCLLFGLLLLLAATAELWVNSRALLVRYHGSFYFPTYTAYHPGTDFGEDYDYETDYRQLARRFQAEGRGNWLLLPPIPYNPFENAFAAGDGYPPTAPSVAARHLLGTDTTGRDILARLLYGFRYAIVFSLLLLLFTYVIGIAVGCAMGYFGGGFDLACQRLIEIWSNIPFLYIVIIIASLLTPNLAMLLLIVIVFGWTDLTYVMRTMTYREKARDYVAAAQVLGCSTARIIFRHILPNTLSLVVTFIPFSVIGGITALTSLDFLGFGLPPPTPSWGELLKQATSNLDAPWIAAATFGALVIVLSLVTFIGEAIREAFDPKAFSTYQ
jgi:microcin C transport system permease protein